MHPRASGIVVIALAVLVLIGALADPGTKPAPTAAAGPPSPGPSTSAPASTVAPLDDTQQGRTTALALLSGLPIKGRAARTGYSRAQFGPAWTDDNDDPSGHNGCDTRNDVLRRDLGAVVLEPNSNGCAVRTGTLRDPYTATTIRFSRGEATSNAVQIDHVVALGNAWQTGAARYDARTRTDLANDPLNLLTVDGPTNEAKSDGDAATWLPPNKAYRCAYVARQIAVKARYRLWVTQAENDAMDRVLGSCPDQLAPTEPGSSTVQLAPRSSTPTSRPPTVPAPDPTSAQAVYYPNCAAVRAAGAAPIHRGQPGYSASLDRDGDGVACE